MADTITLPLAGPVSKKYLGYGLMIIALIAAVEYYRKQKAASAAATASTATPIDPATGLPLNSPEDVAALQAQTAAAGGAYTGGSGSGTVPSPVPGTGLTTNAQWAQNAIDYLVNTVHMDEATVSAALGEYLSGGQLTPAQVEIVHQANAVEGPPPVAAPDGYPPNLRPAPAAPPPPPSGGGYTGPPGTPKVGAAFEGPWMVQRGQTKQSIAAHFGLTTTQLDQANPGATYQPGSGLKIPWLIQYGQTMQYIAAAFEIPVAQIAPYVPVY